MAHTQTNISAASYLRSAYIEEVRFTFIECWSSVYNGYPDIIRNDQGSVFADTRFEDLRLALGIDMQYLGIESHNSLYFGEKYYRPLKQIYSKISPCYPKFRRDIKLALAENAMNDIKNFDGLVPSLFIFGVLLRFPAIYFEVPGKLEPMNALDLEHCEMETVTAKLRLRQTLQSGAPFSVTQHSKNADEVLIFQKPVKIK